MKTALATTTDVFTINLDAGCSDVCAPFALAEFELLNQPRYSFGVSVLRVESFDYWLGARERRTARRKIAKTMRASYSTSRIERADWVEDIYTINTSRPERQGRPMGQSYIERPQFSRIGSQACDLHRFQAYGVIAPDSHLAAYLEVYRVGELLHVSRLLDHAGYRNGDESVMCLLFRDAILDQLRFGPVSVFYNRHDSGLGGLRQFKEWIGFRKADVEWQL